MLSSLAIVSAFLLPLTFSPTDELLAAQKSKPYALIAGTVWGPDDRPVYGVTVNVA